MPQRGRLPADLLIIQLVVVVVGAAAYHDRKDLRAGFESIVAELRGVVVQGTVVDAGTGEGVAGARVRVTSPGVGFPVLDQVDGPTSIDGVSSSTGTFRIQTRLSGSPTFWVDADGYRSTYVTPHSITGLRIVLHPSSGDSSSVREFIVRLPVRTFEERFTFDLQNRRLASPGEPYDVALTLLGRRRGVRVDAGPGAGVTFREEMLHGEREVDPRTQVVVDSIAPESAYGSVFSQPVDAAAGLCVVRTRDGRHFGKFEVNPFDFSRLENPEFPPRRPEPVEIRIFVNVRGGRLIACPYDL